MTSGIRVYNDGGQLIISDASTTFYYYGPAEMAQVVGSGVNSGVTIRTYNSYSSAPIIPFVYTHSTDLVAITRIYRGYANYWFLEVAQGGLDAPAPEILIFTTADAENWNSRFYRGDRLHGIKVKRQDGSTSFDSSVGQPLAVRSAFDVIPPYEPTAGGQNLAPVQYNPYGLDPSISQPMFGYYSMALAEREFTAYQYSRECTGIGAYGACIGFQDVTTRVDRYWSFYHAAMGRSGNTLMCGWVEYSNGHLWNSSTSSGFSIFIPIISLGGSSYGSGQPPFVTATINYTGQKVLVADKAMYPGTNYTYTPPIPNAPSNLLAQTQIDASGKNLLVADWQNSPTYPFAITYNVYVRKTGTYQWFQVGATNKTNASGGAPYYDFPSSGVLYAGQTLNTDVWLWSPNRTCFLVCQSDGNFVLYRTTNGGPPYSWLWQTATSAAAGYSPARLVMQTDGNLVGYRNSDNKVLFQSYPQAGYVNYAMYVADDFSITQWFQNSNNAWQLRQVITDPWGYYTDGGQPSLPLAYWDVKIVSVNANGVEGGSIVATSTATALPAPPADSGGG